MRGVHLSSVLRISLTRFAEGEASARIHALMKYLTALVCPYRERCCSLCHDADYASLGEEDQPTQLCPDRLCMCKIHANDSRLPYSSSLSFVKDHEIYPIPSRHSPRLRQQKTPHTVRVSAVRLFVSTVTHLQKTSPWRGE